MRLVAEGSGSRYIAHLHGGSLSTPSPPFDPSANAGQKLRCIERFCYVVICTKVKHENPVCWIPITQHEKWNILRFLPDLATEVLHMLAPRPYIQNDKIGFSGKQYFRYHGRKVWNGDHLVAD